MRNARAPVYVPSRRDVLGLAGGLALTGLTVAGCDLLSTDPGSGDGNDNSWRVKGKQAPSLEQLVKSGDLPPLSQRLPRNPLVVEPTDEAGRYGGTWHSYLDGLAAVGYKFFVELGYDPLVSWTPDWTEMVPNLAEGWEADDDGRAYVFHLREGAKWSDGEPFTADDIGFVFDDIWGNTEISPIPPQMFSTAGKLATFEKIDDHTIRISFDEPQGLFIRRLATPSASGLIVPRHYMEQFHLTHNPDAEAMAKDEGFDDWIAWFGDRNTATTNPDRPSLNAWLLTTSVDESAGRGVFKRNPYHWKVDPDGSQLPYIDQVTYEILDLEVVLLRTTNGELEFNAPALTGGVATLDNKPVLARGPEKGEYEFIDGVPGSMNVGVISLNLNHKNLVLREVFQNRDFRIGLSYAIDRQEIANAVDQRLGEPWQAAPRKESEFFDDTLAKQYTDYDPDLANQHLDRAGYDQRDGQGYRLGPGGKRIVFSMEPSPTNPTRSPRWTWSKTTGPRSASTCGSRTKIGHCSTNAKQPTCTRKHLDGRRRALRRRPGPTLVRPLQRRIELRTLWATWYTTRGAEGERPPLTPGPTRPEQYYIAD